MAGISDLMAEILSANIKTLRVSQLKETQTDFAHRLSVTQGTVARWEAGAKPEYEHIVKMAQLAGVPVQNFTGQVLTQSDRPHPIAGGNGALLLPVQFPSEDALTQMFEGLLETIPANAEFAEIAQKLAQLLPGALVKTLSHLQAETDSLDPPWTARSDSEAGSRSSRTPRR